MSVEVEKAVIPDHFEPLLLNNGLMNPIWYEYLQQKQKQIDAIQDEVNKQHP